MTKAEWYDLIQKEFNVSRNVAKTMFCKMCEIKEIKSVNRPIAAAMEKAGIKW